MAADQTGADVAILRTAHEGAQKKQRRGKRVAEDRSDLLVQSRVRRVAQKGHLHP